MLVLANKVELCELPDWELYPAWTLPSNGFLAVAGSSIAVKSVLSAKAETLVKAVKQLMNSGIARRARKESILDPVVKSDYR
jgi:hypothetical protein